MAECYHVGPVEDPCRYIVAEAKPLATDSGQGSVFRATTIQDGREIAVALKQLHGVGPDDLDRIVRRLRPLEGLSHPHLAEHIEAFVGPPLDVVTSTPDEFDLVYVASLWVEGPMLADAAADAPGLRRLNWIVEVGWAAAHLHSVRSTDSPNGLIHRDIKPSNIVVEAGEHAVLIDFGLVRPISTEPTDTRMFSAAWMAPETFARLDNASPRSDAWAVGQLAYWALCGQQPSWQREPQLLRSRLASAATDLGVPEPASVSAHIVKLLAEDPNARPDLVSWCEELEGLLSRPVVSPRRRGLGRLVAVLGVSALAGMALVGDIARPEEREGSKGGTPAHEQTIRQQQGTQGADTFRDPYGAAGKGERVAPLAVVEVGCKVHGPQIDSANPDGYWYRLESPPWNGEYYAVANTFWNGDVMNERPYIHNTDFDVPDCPDAAWSTLDLPELVALLEQACIEEAILAADLQARLDAVLFTPDEPVAVRVEAGRAAVAILRGNRVMRTLPRPTDTEDRQLVDAFVADYFAGAAQIESAVDALEAGDARAFTTHRDSGVANLTDALGRVVDLGAPSCDPR